VVPGEAHQPSGGRPLDPIGPDPGAARPSSEAPAGLWAELQAARAALIRVLRAHLDLARAEADEIKSEVTRTAALGGVAFASLILVAFLLPIGLFLFLGETLFGSLGWGVLHGTLLLVAAAVFAVLLALRSAGLGRAMAIAFAIGLVVTIVFGTNALAIAYRQIADVFPAAADPGDVSFAVGAGIGVVIFGIVGVVLGARAGTAGAAIGGLVGGAAAGALLGLLGAGLVRLTLNPLSRPMMIGAIIWGLASMLVAGIAGARTAGWRAGLGAAVAGLVLGGLFGAFTAITFSWQVAIAIGIALFLGLAPAIAGVYAANGGIDLEALKSRYIPQATIDTAKETMEWAKARMPGGGS
jgi:hypothetical protein